MGGEPGSQGRGREREAGPKGVGLQGLEAKNTGKPALSVHRTLWVPGIAEPWTSPSPPLSPRVIVQSLVAQAGPVNAMKSRPWVFGVS